MSRHTTARIAPIAAAAVVLLVLPHRALRAQEGAPNRESAVEVRKQFLADLDTLQSKFLALAEAFPADKYAWRPAKGVRTASRSWRVPPLVPRPRPPRSWVGVAA